MGQEVCFNCKKIHKKDFAMKISLSICKQFEIRDYLDEVDLQISL